MDSYSPKGWRWPTLIWTTIGREFKRPISWWGGRQVIQYVDVLLICSPTEELGYKHVIEALSFLAEKGYASKNKAQIHQQSVEYLDLVLTPGERMLFSE